MKVKAGMTGKEMRPMAYKKASMNDHDADDMKKKKNKSQSKLGSGGRFAALKNSVADEYEKKGKSPSVAQKIGAAVAAKQGQKKYGVSKMASMAAKGKKTKKK